MQMILVVYLLTLLATDGLAADHRFDGENDGYSRELLARINLYRVEKGLGELHPDRTLARLAESHSRLMFSKRAMSHNNFDDRFARAGSRHCVENVGWNYSSPQQMFEGWRRSSGHDRNMLHEKLTRAGIAEVGAYVTFLACEQGGSGE